MVFVATESAPAIIVVVEMETGRLLVTVKHCCTVVVNEVLGTVRGTSSCQHVWFINGAGFLLFFLQLGQWRHQCVDLNGDRRTRLIRVEQSSCGCFFSRK